MRNEKISARFLSRKVLGILYTLVSEKTACCYVQNGVLPAEKRRVTHSAGASLFNQYKGTKVAMPDAYVAMRCVRNDTIKARKHKGSGDPLCFLSTAHRGIRRCSARPVPRRTWHGVAGGIALGRRSAAGSGVSSCSAGSVPRAGRCRENNSVPVPTSDSS